MSEKIYDYRADPAVMQFEKKFVDANRAVAEARKRVDAAQKERDATVRIFEESELRLILQETDSREVAKNRRKYEEKEQKLKEARALLLKAEEGLLSDELTELKAKAKMQSFANFNEDDFSDLQQFEKLYSQIEQIASRIFDRRMLAQSIYANISNRSRLPNRPIPPKAGLLPLDLERFLPGTTRNTFSRKQISAAIAAAKANIQAAKNNGGK